MKYEVFQTGKWRQALFPAPCECQALFLAQFDCWALILLTLPDSSFTGLRQFSSHACTKPHLAGIHSFLLRPGNTDTLVSADSQLHLLDLKTLPSSAQAPPSGTMAWELTHIIPLTLFVFSAVYCLMSNVLKNSFKYLSGFLVVSGRRVNQLHSILDNGANRFYTHRISWLQGHNHFLSIFLT